MTTPRIAAQLYSLREAGDLDTQLSLARAAGFDWVESVAGHGLPPDGFAAKVAAHGLRVSSMHVALTQAESDPASIIALCAATGCRQVIVPWLPVGERPSTPAGWQAIGARLAAIADALAPAGLALAYHNHEFEFLHYGGRTALEWIFSAAPPQRLGWEADLGWVSRAGLDPRTAVETHAERLVCVHAKDIAPDGTAVDEDGWCALGQGIVPWPALFAQLRSRVPLFVLEHDRPKDPAAMLKTSFAFMHQHLS